MSFFEFMSPYMGYFTVFGLLLLGLLCRKVLSVLFKKERNEDIMKETQIRLKATVCMPTRILNLMMQEGLSKAEIAFLIGLASNIEVIDPQPLTKEEDNNGQESCY